VLYKGADFSNHNGTVDMGQVAADGVTFVHAKATESSWFYDQFYLANKHGAQAHGLHFGGYHFARPDKNRPGVEAEFFASKIGKPSPGDCAPVLDLEAGSGDLTLWAGQVLSTIERLTGARPILYSYSAFIQAHLNLRALAGYPLWLADYGANDGVEHPAHLSSAEHQFTSRGVLKGVIGHVDLNSAASLTPLLVPAPTPAPKPAKLWPVPVPAWFWTWAQWRQDNQSYARPEDAPSTIPPWAWVRLKAL
jgi:lysozyme